jgi:uncharacterized protein YbcV (DUF1398 family)
MAREGEQNVVAMEEVQQQDFYQKQPREGSLLESIRNMSTFISHIIYIFHPHYTSSFSHGDSTVVVRGVKNIRNKN